MNYPYLLFDADDTLFDFPKAASKAFAYMCQIHDVPHSPETYQLYHEINRELWAAFDRREVTKDFVTLERYVRFLKALNLERDPVSCNADYLAALGEGVYPLPYAEEV
ncbi:MAG: noncanonical pyrimidine nucleotidase, YjjG family, partial [Oscillibacter sp.]|nr:noncanonical pyrimidine nucleotidase, YjjG family [Oscillibacter sp.]